MSREVVKQKDPQEKLRNRIEDFMAERATKTEGVGRATGNKILLPEGMTLDTAVKELTRIIKQEETVIEVTHYFSGWHMMDALNASNEVISREFGWINSQAIQTFFGDIRPEYVEVITGVKPDGSDIVKTCVEGKVVLSALEDAEMYVFRDRSRQELLVKFKIKQKYRSFAEYVINEIKSELRENSIYRGKILQAQGHDFKFVNIKKTDIVLPVDSEALVQLVASRMAACEERTTALFFGAVGTGKTEMAQNIGIDLNQNNNHTVIFVKDQSSDKLEFWLKMAKNYQSPGSLLIYED